MNYIFATRLIKENNNTCDICLDAMDKINKELGKLNAGWKEFLSGDKRFKLLLRRFAYYNSIIGRKTQETDEILEEFKEVQDEE